MAPWMVFSSETQQPTERMTSFPRDAQDVPEMLRQSPEAGEEGESFVQHIWIWMRTSAHSPPAAKHRACTEGTANSPVRGTASDPAQN